MKKELQRGECKCGHPVSATSPAALEAAMFAHIVAVHGWNIYSRV